MDGLSALRLCAMIAHTPYPAVRYAPTTKAHGSVKLAVNHVAIGKPRNRAASALFTEIARASDDDSALPVLLALENAPASRTG
jgi:hypothetical protein